MKFFLITMLLFTEFSMRAQVGIGTAAPAPSAALEIRDSTRGILIPRLTSVQRSQIVNPAEGLMVYQRDGTKGYWYFDGVVWKNISSGNSTNNGGKNTIILGDDITNQEAQIKIANDFGPNTQEIKIAGCTNLTTVDLSMVITAINIDIENNSVLQSINLQNLTQCDGDLNVKECPQLNNINLSSLTKVIGLYGFRNTGLTSVNLPAFIRTTQEIDFENNRFLTSVSFASVRLAEKITINGNPVLTSISFPILTTLSSLSIQNSDLLNSISFPVLSIAGSLNIDNNKAITSIAFPALTGIVSNISPNNTSSVTNCANLTFVSFDVLSSFQNASFAINENKLSSTQINYLLHKFVSISPALTYTTFDFSQNNPPAPPTGQGLADKATLISEGNYVVTD